MINVTCVIRNNRRSHVRLISQFDTDQDMNYMCIVIDTKDYPGGHLPLGPVLTVLV